VVNEYEYNLFLKKTGLEQRDILEQARGVLVTKGANGAWLAVDGREYEIPVVPPIRVTEPTGVGDAFRAGLMRGMQLGLPWELAGRMGALAATYVLEQMGAQNHNFTRAEYVARFRQHFDDEGALDAILN
jgi:adenosine kinase